MKTTLVIPDPVMDRVRREAARLGITISELVEDALRLFLDRKPAPKELPPLPTYDCGPLLVDIADREALYDLFDQDENEK